MALFRRRIHRAAIHVVGVVEEARGRGIGSALAARALRHMAKRGYHEAEWCMVLEGNDPSHRIARRFGGAATKNYLTFEKTL
jgi:ribosomal protein S18 acetylase RimI-like enzyme